VSKKKKGRKIEYRVVCAPTKLTVKDLVKVAFAIQAPYFNWIDGYLVGISKMWDKKHPNVHFIVEILYAELEKYHGYVILDSKGQFKGFADDLKKMASDEGFIPIVKANSHYPMIKKVMKAIKDRERKK